MDLRTIQEQCELPECRIRKVSSADLADFIDWVEFHRREWTVDGKGRTNAHF